MAITCENSLGSQYQINARDANTFLKHNMTKVAYQQKELGLPTCIFNLQFSRKFCLLEHTKAYNNHSRVRNTLMQPCFRKAHQTVLANFSVVSDCALNLSILFSSDLTFPMLMEGRYSRLHVAHALLLFFLKLLFLCSMRPLFFPCVSLCGLPCLALARSAGRGCKQRAGPCFSISSMQAAKKAL